MYADFEMKTQMEETMRANLFTHSDDDIWITGIDITNCEIHTSFDPNSEKP